MMAYIPLFRKHRHNHDNVGINENWGWFRDIVDWLPCLYEIETGD